MKKKKFPKQLPLFDEEGNESILTGRHQCFCEGSKHSLISNCLVCGRIVCEQEGVGECFTCGTYIFTKQEREDLLSGSEKCNLKIQQMVKSGIKLDFIDQIGGKPLSLKQIAASLSQNKDNSLDHAIENKNRLLEYDATSVARSKVFDDQVDYFTIQNQNFISSEARKKIQDKVNYLHENKFNKEQKLIIDLENLEIKDYTQSVIEDIDAEHRVLQELSSTKQDYEVALSNYFIENDRASKLPPPIYVPNNNQRKKLNINDDSDKLKTASKLLKMDIYSSKIQGCDLEKIEDRGMCLAMHQPYASLLVNGIKRFEGRTWYSPFRGRLWIYANAKTTLNDIDRVEGFYRQLGYEKFPQNYPTACIVGCVTIVDCLPLEVYRERFPEAEIDSPYAFICEYPISLERGMPIEKGGGNKIYKMNTFVHKACKSMLGF